jgi:hypothetical protein
MARFPTYPPLLDEVLQISISKLKEWGYLKPHQVMSGAIRWSRNKKKTTDIDIRVDTHSNYIELSYSYDEEPVNYTIKIVSLPSNIGKGQVWYFECPSTKKRCRKLYLVGKYFLHRTAFGGCMYVKQTKSKNIRKQIKMIDAVFKTTELYEQIYSKHLKKSYAGRPTKKYIRLMSKIQRAES